MMQHFHLKVVNSSAEKNPSLGIVRRENLETALRDLGIHTEKQGEKTVYKITPPFGGKGVEVILEPIKRELICSPLDASHSLLEFLQGHRQASAV